MENVEAQNVVESQTNYKSKILKRLRAWILIFCYCIISGLIMLWLLAPNWLTITVKEPGQHYVPELEGYFESTRLAPREVCVTVTRALPQHQAKVMRNFTALSPENATEIQRLKQQLKTKDYIAAYVKLPVNQRESEINSENAKRRMFGHWVRDELAAFHALKSKWQATQRKADEHQNIETPRVAMRAVPLNPVPYTRILMNRPQGSSIFRFAKELNGSDIRVQYYLVPEQIEAVMFSDWVSVEGAPQLLYAYTRDLDLPAYVRSDDGLYFYLKPPAPQNDLLHKNYVYKRYESCQFGLTYSRCSVNAIIACAAGEMTLIFLAFSAYALVYDVEHEFIPSYSWFSAIALLSCAFISMVIALLSAYLYRACVIPEPLIESDLEFEENYYATTVGSLAALAILIILPIEFYSSYKVRGRP